MCVKVYGQTYIPYIPYKNPILSAEDGLYFITNEKKKNFLPVNSSLLTESVKFKKYSK